MKVLLIYPPADNTMSSGCFSLVDEEAGFYPPLGLLYVAAYSAEQHEVEILDMQAEKIDCEGLKWEISSRQPDVVGIQALTFMMVDVLKVAKVVKEVDPNIKVILGGPHVNIYPEETIQLPQVDYLVLGEGELPFLDLLNGLESNLDLSSLTGLVFKRDGQVINTGPRPLLDDLDLLPFPARRLTKYNDYYSLLAKHRPITTMITSRGCPYRCIYCDRPHLGKKFRARSATNVVDEMQDCVDLGIHQFAMYDDTITVNRQRVLDICNEIVDRRLKVYWDARTRVDNVDEELLHVMKGAGCERIHYGVESGSPEVLKTLRKGITLEQVELAFRLSKEAGIETLAYFMIGSPEETKAQVKATMDLSKKLDPDFAHFSITTPYPGTPLYTEGLSRGETDYWKDFAKNPESSFKPRPWTWGPVSEEELADLLKEAYRTFYSRPSYILNRLLKVRTVGEFKRKVRAGLKVLKL